MERACGGDRPVPARAATPTGAGRHRGGAARRGRHGLADARHATPGRRRSALRRHGARGDDHRRPRAAADRPCGRHPSRADPHARERADAAERERASAEGERVAAERERVAAEQARSSADQARRSAEQAGLSARGEADALRRGRDAESARVRAEERAALARDMHDSVSHHLASIAMHAGAMAYREDLDPATSRETARTVRDAAQHANREPREVLVALRTADDHVADDAAPLATVPTLREAVDRARAGGQEVSLELDGLDVVELERLGRGTVVALARILGEALTNAAKHAPGSAVTVLLARRGEQVTLTVENPLTGEAQPLSTGHGLIGVEERARLLGGGARWTRTEHGTFEMEAWPPW
ncbi:histidine kinase [Brachybacterium sp. GPGPB12]|uniref:histidine kinase n=1 Tax=Brachybacterium sp. GPGPB12 TaxID=3023517 RepID=UPI0031344B24